MSSPRVLSLFTGAGGLDYGLEAAGFKTVAAVEMDHDCCETLRQNRKGWNPIEESIFDVKTSTLLGFAKAKSREVELLVGGPPCQPFSKAGYWSRGDSLRLDDPRAHTLSAYMRVVREALPKVFLLENVEGLAFAGKDEGLRLLQRQVEAINAETGSKYQPNVKVVSAAEHGVPQLRERVIMVASRDGKKFNFPAATHADPAANDHNLQPFATAWDAIGGLRAPPTEDLDVKGKWADLLPSIPEGKNYLHHTDRGDGLALFGWRRRYWSFLLKLAKDRPSWTIQAQPGPAIGPFHWDSRRLSIRELCRLQTFPDDVTIFGGRTSQQRQLGNAVPSLLAEVLGRAISEQLLGVNPKGTLQLLPKRRATIPPPVTPAAVPARFRRLVGEHEPHPGTGQGYGALARAVA